MKYKIQYFYRVGDSFSSEDRTSILEFEWENIDRAKEALQRIKEHYLWFKSLHDYSRFNAVKIERPVWHDVGKDYEGMVEYVINLPLDAGNEVQFHVPWCGYFEALYSAEIIVDDSAEGMKIDLSD